MVCGMVCQSIDDLPDDVPCIRHITGFRLGGTYAEPKEEDSVGFRRHHVDPTVGVYLLQQLLVLCVVLLGFKII